MFPASHRGTELQYHMRKKKGVMRKVQFDRKSWSPVSSVAYRLPKRTAANQRCSKEAGLLQEGKSPYPLGENRVRVSGFAGPRPSPTLRVGLSLGRGVRTTIFAPGRADGMPWPKALA